MRIIAGKHRGRRLLTPKNDAIRPTSDRVRESLFSILGNVHDAVVVDGYAGTGALGCEALSRGAKACWFFDASRDAIELVRGNVAALGEEAAAHVRCCKFARGMAEVTEDVDLIFLDPPYGSSDPLDALRAIAASSRARAGALVILEQDKTDAVPVHEAFDLDDQREYGSTRLTFFVRLPDTE